MRASDHPYFAQPLTALAHRGGSLHPDNLGRENTLHAFDTAVGLGYTHIETDVHATRDGVLVAFHDDKLDRVTDAEGAIADLTLAEVKRARIGGIDEVPTLDEVLDAFPDTFVNIDIKASGAVEPLVRAIDAHAAHDRVCVGSFGISRITAFRRLAGDRVATSAGPLGVAWTSQVPLLPRWLRTPGLAFQIPVEHDVAGKTVRTLTPNLLRNAHAAGKVVHVWTIDDADQMNELVDMGVDGIVTDAIDVLKQVLLERGLWH